MSAAKYAKTVKAADRVKVVGLETIDVVRDEIKIGDLGTVESGGHHPTIIFDNPDVGRRLLMAWQLDVIEPVGYGGLKGGGKTFMQIRKTQDEILTALGYSEEERLEFWQEYNLMTELEDDEIQDKD